MNISTRQIENYSRYILVQIEKKSFFTQNAVTPFNPLELDKDFPKITRPTPQRPQKPKVHFEQDGKKSEVKGYWIWKSENWIPIKNR